MREEQGNGTHNQMIVMGAAAFGLAGGGYMAGRVAGARKRLSEQRRPFAWRPDRGSSVFLKNADLIDVRRGQVQRKRGIVFKDGQITDIVATRDLDGVEAGRAFDCTGLYVMPGLINAHVHSMMPCASMVDLDLMLSIKRQAVRNLEECATHGVTTIRDAGGLPLVQNELSRRIESLEILGPRVISCGPDIMVKGGYPNFLRPLPRSFAKKYGDPALYVSGPESAREAVRKAVEQGARFIKIFFDDVSLFFGSKPLNTMDDESVRALVEEAHRLGRRVGAHQTQLKGFRRALRLGVDDLEHVPIDGPFTEADVGKFMKGDHCFTPTVSADLGLGIVPEGHPSRSKPVVEWMQLMREKMLDFYCPAMAEDAVVRSNRKMVKLYLEGDPAASLMASTLFDNERFISEIEESGSNVTKLYEAGATFCCGNDGGIPLSFPGALSVEMLMLERLGLSRQDVLRAATANAARLLDMENELGTLEPGKLADLLVLSADPLKDMRAIERVEAVFRSGVMLHRGGSFMLEARRVEE